MAAVLVSQEESLRGSAWALGGGDAGRCLSLGTRRLKRGCLNVQPEPPWQCPKHSSRLSKEVRGAAVPLEKQKASFRSARKEVLRFSVEVPLRCFMRSSSHDWSGSNKTPIPPPGTNALLSYSALWGLHASSSPLLIVGVLLCHPPTLVKKWCLILVLARIEVIFFTLAGVVLCFGFGVTILPITPRWVSCG